MDFSPVKQAYLNEAYGVNNPKINQQAGQAIASTAGAVADLILIAPVAKSGAIAQLGERLHGGIS